MINKRPIRVLVPERRTFNLNSQSVYVRVVEPLSWLKEHGLVDYAIISEFDSHAVAMLNWADIVIFNKHSSNEAYSLALQAKEKNKKVIYDIDDNIFNVPGNLTVFSRVHQESIRIVALADKVVVENDRLLNTMNKFHHNITIIPNGLFTEKYPLPSPKRTTKPVCIFSAYVPSLNKFIIEFIKAITAFKHSHKNIRLDLYGNNAMSIPMNRLIPPSGYADYMKSIVASGSLMGIVPVWGNEDPDSIMYRDCKSPIKYIMYGYAGIPSIYTNALPYTTCVVDSENGLLVENSYSAWLDAMDRLVKDRPLRKKIQKNAFADVCTNFHIKKNAMAYYNTINEIITP